MRKKNTFGYSVYPGCVEHDDIQSRMNGMTGKMNWVVSVGSTVTACMEWFIPESIRSLSHEHLRARFLVLASFFVAWIMAFILIVEVILGTQPFPFLGAAIGLLACISVPVLLKSTQNLQMASQLPVLLFAVTFSFIALVRGGLLSTSASLLLLLPMLSSFFCGIRFMRNIAWTLWIFLSLLLVLHYADLYTEYDMFQSMSSLFFRYIAFSSIVFLSVVLTHFQSVMRKQVEDLLEKSEERYTLAIQGTNDGIYDWDLVKQKTYLSEQFQELLGYESGSLQVTTPLDPDLFAPVDYKHIHTALETCKQGRHPFIIETRMCTASGESRWFHIRGGLQFEAGQPVRMVGSIRDISERKHLELLKEEFISNMSHEFRTPLTSIMGALRLLGQKSGFSLSQRSSLLQIAERNSQRLLRLVNDMLDLQKLQAGLVPLSCTWVDLHAVVQESITLHRPLSDKKGIYLHCATDDTSPPIWADLGRIHQILGNLISNAIKFSFENDEVILRIVDKKTSICIEVEDHGPGIPLAFQEQLFERFTRWDEANNPQGTGLGLAITKRIVEAHNGCITFTSTAHEKTLFCVELPRCRREEEWLEQDV